MLLASPSHSSVRLAIRPLAWASVGSYIAYLIYTDITGLLSVPYRPSYLEQRLSANQISTRSTTHPLLGTHTAHWQMKRVLPPKISNSFSEGHLGPWLIPTRLANLERKSLNIISFFKYSSRVGSIFTSRNRYTVRNVTLNVKFCKTWNFLRILLTKQWTDFLWEAATKILFTSLNASIKYLLVPIVFLCGNVIKFVLRKNYYYFLRLSWVRKIQTSGA